MDGHQFTDLAEMCAQTVFRCLHLARIGRPDISWTVSASDRTVTEWNRACAKRLAKLISCLECTSGPPQCCRVGDKGSECRPSVFQSADVAGELADSRSTSGRIVKDDTGGCAVFTERGASASHVTAATVLDTFPVANARGSTRCCFRIHSGQDERCPQIAPWRQLSETLG